jgi:hypothetical protein
VSDIFPFKSCLGQIRGHPMSCQTSTNSSSPRVKFEEREASLSPQDNLRLCGGSYPGTHSVIFSTGTVSFLHLYTYTTGWNDVC